MGVKTSPIWTTPLKEFEKIVAQSKSLSEIFNYFNISLSGGSYRALKQRLEDDNIDYSHIRLGGGCNKGRTFPKTSIDLSKVMVKNSSYCRGHLKKRLLKKGILENTCEICYQGEIWNDQKLVMVLDHKNGKRNDHRIENLQMLCPNCNSQQKTFAGRQNKKKYYCEKCGDEKKSRNSKTCYKCSGITGRKVKNRPSREQLLKEIEETNYCAVGRKYGVSDKAVRKWLK